MSDTTLHNVAQLSEIEEGIPFSARLPDGTAVCLVREGQIVHALLDRCPHRDFALSGGDVVAPGVIECPWHGARFDCRTGKVLQGPSTDDAIVYAVRVDGDDVFVGPAF